MCQIPDRIGGFRIDDYEPRERKGGGRHGHKEGVGDIKIQGPVGLFS
jgi:hypothetical protein